MHIVIADAFPQDHVEQLRDAGHVVDLDAAITAESLGDHLGGCDIVVVRSTKVTADAIRKADRLALVVRAGAGVNTIDVAAAAEAGVLVANTPGKNSVAVAELAIGLMLAIDRSIPDAVADARDGRWRKQHYSRARGISGRTLGVVGLGAIGLEVAMRAKALGMRVVALDHAGRSADRQHRIAAVGVELVADRDEMLGACDVVSLHVPVSPSGGPLVDAGFIEAMRDGAWLINTSRGDVIDEAALLAALDERGFRAGLDVVADEPSGGESTIESRLAGHPSVYVTPHIGASTDQAQHATADAVVSLIRGFGSGRMPHGVNLDEGGSANATLFVRHRNVVGALAGVLGVLRGGGLNVEHMTNQLFAGGTAASAIIDVHGDVSDEITEGVLALELVMGITVTYR